MKKIILILFALFVFNSGVLAQTPVNFVYIHGADQGTAEEFQAWIDKMHPDMKKNLSANELFEQKVLNNSYIKDDAQMLYWADKVAKDKSIVTTGLSISKKLTSPVSNMVRSLIAYMLHDVVWLQKYSNMKPILDDLNKTVINNAKKGEKTILAGYSAGTLITYQYLLNKTKFLNPVHFMNKHQKELNLSSEDIGYVKKYAGETTCLDAIIDSNVAFMNADGGLMLNPDKKQRLENIKKIKMQTVSSCIPDNSVKGIVNFGSPLLVFYTNVADDKSQLQYFTKKLIQYMVESDQFFISVNYKKDPIAIPSKIMSYADICHRNNEVKNGGGFIYQTLVNGGSNVVAGHLKYWSSTNNFTKSVAKSYEKGYKLFYEQQ